MKRRKYFAFSTRRLHDSFRSSLIFTVHGANEMNDSFTPFAPHCLT